MDAYARNFYTFWQFENTAVVLIFTIFYFLIGYFVNVLLAIVIWIMINLSWLFNRLADENVLSEININIFYGSQVGFLSQARDLLLKFTVYYFMCVALAILSYASPAQRVSYQMLFYVSIDLLGILMFLSGLLSLRKILD